MAAVYLVVIFHMIIGAEALGVLQLESARWFLSVPPKLNKLTGCGSTVADRVRYLESMGNWRRLGLEYLGFRF